MSLRVGSAYLDVLPRVGKSFDGDMDRQLSGPTARAGKKAGGILGSGLAKAAVAAAATATLAIGAHVIKDSIAGARESNKVAAQTEQVIRSTAGAAHVTAKEFSDLANAIARKTGIDDEQIQTSENLLATFTNIRNGMGKNNRIFDKATQAVVDMSAVQGDLRSNSILVGKALQDPVKGVTALQRVGVKLTDQQKDQIKWLVASGRTMDAQRVILKELGTEFGGQAAAQATATQKLKVIWGNIEEDLGNKLIPVIDRTATWLADKLPRAEDATFRAFDRLGRTVRPLGRFIGNFGDEVVRAVNPAASLAVEIGKLVGASEDSPTVAGLAAALERVGDHLSPLTDWLGGISSLLTGQVHAAVDGAHTDFHNLGIDGVELVTDKLNASLDVWDKATEKAGKHKDAILPLVAGLTAFSVALVGISKVSSLMSSINGIVSGLGAVVAAVGGTVGIVIAIVAAVVAALVVAYLKVKPFRVFVDGLARTVSRFAVVAARHISDWAQTVAGAARQVMAWLRPIWDQLWAGATTVGRVAGLIGRRIAEVPGMVGRALARVPAFFRRHVIEPLRPLGRFLRDEVGPTIGAVGEFVGAVFGQIGVVLRAVWSVVQPILAGLADQLKSVAHIVSVVLAGAWKILEPVVSTVARVIGQVVVALARTAIPILRTAFDGLLTAVRVVWNGIVASIRIALSIVRGIFQVATGLITGKWSKVWEGLKSIVIGPLRAVRDFVSRSFDAIVGFVIKLPDRLGGAASALWDGLKNVTGTVLLGVVATVSKILDTLKDIWHGAWRSMRRVVNRLWDGMGDGLKAAINAILAGIEFGINGAIRMINTALDGIDKAAGPWVNFGSIPEVKLPKMRAEGGPVMPGGLYVVGERGPELMQMGGTAGRVFPHEQLMAAIHGAARTDAGGPLVRIDRIEADRLTAGELVDAVNARLGWTLTTRLDR